VHVVLGTRDSQRRRSHPSTQVPIGERPLESARKGIRIAGSIGPIWTVGSYEGAWGRTLGAIWMNELK
jgi:hypothetical protein